VILRCLEKNDIDKVLRDLHDGLVGGKFSIDFTMNKVLKVEYYWLMMLTDPGGFKRPKIQSPRISTK
jgi:hypothetical protein